MKITPLKQIDDIGCGPTSIQMTLDYFKLPIDYKTVAKVSQYKKKDGLTNDDLVETLKKLGLKNKTKINSKWSDLVLNNAKDKVIILSWMLDGYIGHFSVVENVGKDFIELADPHVGKIIKLDKTIFMRLWMDYDNMWYPKKNTDIQLRWMCVVSI